jgi:hypothetical protein
MTDNLTQQTYAETCRSVLNLLWDPSEWTDEVQVHDRDRPRAMRATVGDVADDLDMWCSPEVLACLVNERLLGEESARALTAIRDVILKRDRDERFFTEEAYRADPDWIEARRLARQVADQCGWT